MNKYEYQIPSIVDLLQESGEIFKLLSSQELILNTNWLENNFPIASWGRIVWSKVPESFCTGYIRDPELVTAFNKIVENKQLGGTLVVSWGNGLKLPIAMSMEMLRKYAEDILFEDSDIWICNEQDRWCIEYYHEGEICFGKCRTANEEK